MKKVLVLGGTQFVGRTIVEQLIESDQYQITLFNRGKSNPALFSEIEHIKGDRLEEQDLEKYTKQKWDVIIDASGYWPDSLEKSLHQLKGNVGKYIYISTCSHYVFDEDSSTPLTEEAEIVVCTTEQSVHRGYETYNERKAECERVLYKQKWLDYIIFRSGLIIGEHDPTDRLYYWFYKLQTQKEILWPNNGVNLLSYSNVKDLAALVLLAIEKQHSYSIYNASSLNASLADFMNEAKNMINKKPNLINASPAFLEENNVNQWTDMPLWLNGNFLTVDNNRVIKDFDFEMTSLNKTTKQLIAYYSYGLNWRAPRYGLSKERELELLNILKTMV